MTPVSPTSLLKGRRRLNTLFDLYKILTNTRAIALRMGVSPRNMKANHYVTVMKNYMKKLKMKKSQLKDGDAVAKAAGELKESNIKLIHQLKGAVGAEMNQSPGATPYY